MSKSSISRREFLQLSASAAAMLGLSGCAGIKVNPLAWMNPRRPRPIAPGAKIRIAQIGFGGMGYGDLHECSGENIVALCDVDWRLKYVQKAFKEFPGAKPYKDFRKMLLEMDDQIDAVVISCPDHMHFLPAYMAISMGKHVYVQKPLTQTIGEARELQKLARRHGVCSQMGNQGHSSEGARLIKEWIQSGVIGPVREAHVWTNRPCWPQGMKDQPAPQPVPNDLSWDLWQGRTAERPYNEAYLPFVWRGWRAYGAGALGDMGCHLLDGAFWGLDLGAPTSVEAQSSGLTELAYPTWAIVKYEFPARGAKPPVTLTWYEGGKLPPRPKDMDPDQQFAGGGQLIIGEKASIQDMTDYGLEPRIIPFAKRKELRNQMPAKTLPRIPEGSHHRNWLEAIRAGKPAIACSNFEYSVPLTEMVLLGNLAVFTGKKLEWDSRKMRVTNCPEANRFLNPVFRKGWAPSDLV